jgi:hypothetical protein
MFHSWEQRYAMFHSWDQGVYNVLLFKTMEYVDWEEDLHTFRPLVPNTLQLRCILSVIEAGCQSSTLPVFMCTYKR